MSEFRACWTCGYEKGFHIYLRDAEKGQRIGLICPQCGQSYDLGWVVPDLLETPEKGPIFEG